MAKASRVAIKTAKAVVTVEERLAAIETRLGAMETRLARIDEVLQQLVAAVTADKPSAGQDAPEAKTARKRGGKA